MLTLKGVSPFIQRGPGFLPSDLEGLQLWCKYNSGITVTGAGVSQWDDVSGNANHLKQGTDTNRPSKESDGSILFDGVDNYLKADAFTLVQPETIYLLGKQITWALNDSIFDGNTSNTGRLYNLGITPKIGCYAGGSGAESTELTLDKDAVISVVFDHDNALNELQINHNAPATDATFGTADMGGFTLGSNGASTNFTHFQAKEALVFSTAHDANTREKVINYLGAL